MCQLCHSAEGTDSKTSPLGMVQFPGVCHPVSPCVTLCHPVSPCVTLLTGVEEKEVRHRVAQGDTGWHTPGICTIPKGEAAESIPFSRVAHPAHHLSKFQSTHVCCNTSHCVLTFDLTDPGDVFRVCRCVTPADRY